MLSPIKIAITIAVASGLASATTYANFCDDHACSSNCGESVSVDNPGCLAESGRNSIAFHGDNVQAASLVLSPDSACSCQSQCIDQIVYGEDLDYGGPGCADLTGTVTANSFRFIGGDCGDNNC